MNNVTCLKTGFVMICDRQVIHADCFYGLIQKSLYVTGFGEYGYEFTQEEIDTRIEKGYYHAVYDKQKKKFVQFSKLWDNNINRHYPELSDYDLSTWPVFFSDGYNSLKDNQITSELTINIF